MRLPNGFGSVTKLSGKRRKPYIARVTLGWELDQSSGKAVQRRVTIGTYKTKNEAMQALSEYSANPYDITKQNMTLADLYKKWTADYFPTLKSKSSERTITSAWNYCQIIHSMRIKDIRVRHLKGAIEDAYIIQNHGKNAGEKVCASPATKARMKSMFNLMFDYAKEYELVDENYARLFDLSKSVIKEKNRATYSHTIFSDKEINTLWENAETVRFADWILIQCYMGWRPQEFARLKIENIHLDEQYIVGGMKTDAGLDRPVPIHPRIMKLVQKNYDLAVKLNSPYLLNDPHAVKGGIYITYDKYAGRFKAVIDNLGLNKEHRPHDPRKTFVTMAKKAGVDEYVIKRVVGHSISDLTEDTYTVRDLEWLRKEILKIP